MTPELVIFDCDGVLVDTEPRTNRVIAASLTKYGLPLDDAQVNDMFVGGTMAGVDATARDMGAKLPDNWLDLIYDEMFAAIGAGVPVFTDVEAFLDILAAKGIATAIVSNGPMAKMKVSLTPSGLLDRFHPAIYSAHDYTPKPDPHMIHHAMQIAGATASQTVFIDDSTSGASAGIAAGVRTFGFAPEGDNGKLAATGAEIMPSMRAIAKAIGLPLTD